MNDLDATAATLLLKDLLNVGKANDYKSDSSSNNDKQMMGDPIPTPAAGCVNLLEKLFADAAASSSSIASSKCNEFIIDLRKCEEGISIPIGKHKDVRVDGRSDKSEYLNSKVKIKNIVDLGWENKFNYGQQIAEHCCREYVAYTLKMGSGGGGVRIMKKPTNDRVLIKGIQGYVADLAFAHIKNEILLAIIDNLGNVYVFQIGEDGGISYFPLFQVNRKAQQKCDYNRVMWCKFIPDDFELMPDEQDNFSKLLMVGHNNFAEFYYVDAIISHYGQGLSFEEGDIKVGCDILSSLASPITDASIAPEATTAAVACASGSTTFLHLNPQQKEKPLSVIHEWVPHKKPISSIFFLDDHTYVDPVARFWEYVITGADENRELKLWDCATWTCRQTIKFDGLSDKVRLKASMDLSSNHLILSDLGNSLLYIIQIHKEMHNGKTHAAFFASIAYFHLTYPVVSFTVSAVNRCKYKPLEEHVLNILDKDDAIDEEDTRAEGILIELLWLTTKSLQECSIIFKPLKDIETKTRSPVKLPPLLDQVSVGKVDKKLTVDEDDDDESDTSSPSKEVADILQQTESEENGNTSPEMITEVVTVTTTDLAEACEKLQEHTQYTVPPITHSSEGRTSLPFTPLAQPLPIAPIVPIVNTEEITRQLGVTLSEGLSNEVKTSIVPAVQTSINKIGEDCKLAFLTEARQTTRDAVNKVVCPSFERISQKLFIDIANNMQSGFKQMLERVEGHFETRTRERADLNKRQLEQMLETAVGTMVTHMNKTVETTVQQTMAQCKDVIAKTVAAEMAKHDKMIKNSIREELSKVIAEQRRSLAASPAASLGSVDTQKNILVLQDIRRLLQQSDYKQAFSMALSVSDLDVLIQTLRFADRKAIFQRNKCPLTPHVLVALIQQLSADITSHTQLKLDYLEDAMMTLDTRDETTKQLLMRILPSFTDSLASFNRMHPQHADTRRVDRLRSMAELYTDRVRAGY